MKKTLIIIGAVVAAFTGFSYAELSSMYPKEAAEYVYTKNEKYSFASISNDTNHMVEAAWASLQPLLIELIEKQHKTKIYFISVSTKSKQSSFYVIWTKKISSY